MYYISGGGKEIKGGIWQVKETPKTVTFSLIKKPFLSSVLPDVIKISKDHEAKHCLRVFSDGYTLYPFRNGVPHIFEPIKTSYSHR